MAKLRVKLSLGTLMIVILGIGGVAVSVEVAFSRVFSVLDEALKTRAVSLATLVATELSFAVTTNAQDEISRTVTQFSQNRGNILGVQVVDSQGAQLHRNGDKLPAAIMKSLTGNKAATQIHGTVIYSAAPILDGEKLRGHVFFAESYTVAQEVRTQSRWTNSLTYLAILLFIGLGIFLLGTRLTAPMAKMVRVAQRIADGDLNNPGLQTVGRDEIAQLGQSIDIMAESLREQVGSVKVVAGSVLQNSTAVMGAVSQLSAAANQQASAVAETTSTIEEVKQAGRMANDAAQQIVETSEQSMKTSGQGLGAVQSSGEEMERIQVQVEAIAGGIEDLRTQVGEVGEVIAMVNQIAEQSNLLAVNASIEAAKAGESGLGFAVVAQEVKNLATQSKQATAQVKRTLGSIQSAIEELFGNAQSGRERVEAGVQSIQNTGAVIKDLSKSIDESAQAAKQIAISANEQVVGLEQVAQAMTSINQAASENLASTHQVHEGGSRLNAMASELEQLVARYR